jgi:hypothetical protein
MTSTGSGGLLSNGIRYGAEAYQLLVSMAASACSATNALVPSIAALAAASVIRGLRFTGGLLPGDIGEQLYTKFLNSCFVRRPMTFVMGDGQQLVPGGDIVGDEWRCRP